MQLLNSPPARLTIDHRRIENNPFFPLSSRYAPNYEPWINPPFPFPDRERSAWRAVQLQSISPRWRSPRCDRQARKDVRLCRSTIASSTCCSQGNDTAVDAAREWTWQTRTDHWAQVGYDCFRSDHLAIADGVPEPRRRDPAPGLRRNTPVRYNWVFTLRENRVTQLRSIRAYWPRDRKWSLANINRG